MGSSVRSYRMIVLGLVKIFVVGLMERGVRLLDNFKTETS